MQVDEDGIEMVSYPLAVREDGSTELPEDLPETTMITGVHVETVHGQVLQELSDGTSFTLEDLFNRSQVEFEINDAVRTVLTAAPPSQPPRWKRRGQFLALGQTKQDFRGYRLFAYAVSQVEADEAAELLAVEGSTGKSWIKQIDGKSSHLPLVEFTAGEIGFDGRFQLDLPLPDDPVGWVWLLSGPSIVMGYLEEKNKEPVRTKISIIIPGKLFSIERTDGRGEHELNGLRASGTPPLGVTEDQLIDHADLFSDDPGPYCKPFQNPERILGERRFSTILRIDQPEVAAAAGIRRKKAVERQQDLPQVGSVISEGGSIEEPALSNRAENIDISDEELAEILSTSGMPSLDDMLKVPFKSVVRAGGRAAPTGTALIDWEGDTTKNQAVTVAGGHILDWRVRWRSNGYSIGNVTHTLTLAPRQIKRILKIDFERRERAVRAERLTLEDDVEQGTVSTRTYSDMVDAGLSEWSKGGSKSSNFGAAAGAAGFAAPNVVVGGGAAYGSARSSAWSSGGRDLSVGEEQNLRDAIRQYGESLRRLESTIVTEAQQEETTEGVSEVIANPNYIHALTVVYYEILRHLRVDTELGGVSECLFIPLTITPFHHIYRIQGKGEVKVPILSRLIRYKDVFRRYLRERNLKWVLNYLDDAMHQFKDASGNITVPDGPRSEQKLTALRGEIQVKLAIQSPMKGDEDADVLERLGDAALDQVRKTAEVGKTIGKILKPFASILGIGLSAASATLAVLTPKEREISFQKEIAPRMARSFLNKLVLKYGGPENAKEIKADFTLDGRYREGGVHRVYFSISSSELDRLGITREQISELHLSSEHSLPLYSIANVVEARIRFSTAHYHRSQTTGRIVDDLVVIPSDISDDTTLQESHSVLLKFPPSAWELMNLRDEIREGIQQLLEHIDSHLHYYHKAIWWSMDRDELYTLLDGYTISSTDTRSIASVIEQRPVAILGNMLVFRVARGAFLGVNGYESLEEAYMDYLDNEQKSDPMRISLPTGGLYAQALMDECEACEEHYGNKDWVLEQDQIVPQELDANLLLSRRAEPQGLVPTELPQTLINLQNAPAAPTSSGLQGALDAVTRSDSFRDMAGLAGTQANARAAMQAAQSLASEFGNLAAKKADANRAALERINNSPISDDAKETASLPLKDGNNNGNNSFVADAGDKLAEKPGKYKAKETNPDGTTREVEFEPQALAARQNEEEISPRGQSSGLTDEEQALADRKLESQQLRGLPTIEEENAGEVLVAQIFFHTRRPRPDKLEKDLEPGDTEVLDMLKQDQEFPFLNWRLVGYADARPDREGEPDFNRHLSGWRASAVFYYLNGSDEEGRNIPLHAVDIQALGTQGSDPSRPENFPYNRRVDIFARRKNVTERQSEPNRPFTRAELRQQLDNRLQALANIPPTRRDDHRQTLKRIMRAYQYGSLALDLFEDGNVYPGSTQPHSACLHELFYQPDASLTTVERCLLMLENDLPDSSSSFDAGLEGFLAIVRHQIRIRVDPYYRATFISEAEGKDTSLSGSFSLFGSFIFATSGERDINELDEFPASYEDLPSSYQQRLEEEGLKDDYLSGLLHRRFMMPYINRLASLRMEGEDLFSQEQKNIMYNR